MVTGPFLDRDRILSIAEAHRPTYASAQPFPHAVIDNLFPDEALDALVDEFPSKDAAWTLFDDEAQRQKRTLTELDGEVARSAVAELNGAAMATFLERLTGVQGVIPDPYLVGGGFHQIERGGLLKIHADFNRHPHLRLARRLNVLLYLNRGWQPEWGGALELWSQDMSRCVRSVTPIFNRMVVFSTTSTSYHGHPEPLSCPPDRSRRSLALYYYSADQLADEHGTIFRRRGDEAFADPAIVRSPLNVRARVAAKRFLPPIAVDLLRRR